MPFYCNCLESNRKAGFTISRTQRELGFGKYLEVPVTQDESCKFCGHQSFFSKASPEGLRGERYKQNEWGVWQKDRKITREWLREAQVRK